MGEELMRKECTFSGQAFLIAQMLYNMVYKSDVIHVITCSLTFQIVSDVIILTPLLAKST